MVVVRGQWRTLSQNLLTILLRCRDWGDVPLEILIDTPSTAVSALRFTPLVTHRDRS